MTEATAIRLNLGAGAVPIDGYENLDIKDGRLAYPLQDYADGSVDEVRASHILEHFGEREALDVATEWARVLKPGGVLKLAVPDFEWVLAQYGAVPAHIPYDLTKWQALLRAFVGGGQVDEHDVHNSIWTRSKLTQLMDAVGLGDISVWQSEIEDCAALPVSLNLQGVKRASAAGAGQPGVKVTAVMSVPRLGFMTNMGCCTMALAPMGIPIITHTGAFWGQTLTKAMLDALEAGADYIITVDYDTVFAQENVRYMLRTMVEHPEFDALAGVQLKRHEGTVLFTVAGEDGVLLEQIHTSELTGEFVRVASANFGLTVLRASALRDLPHPWFLGVPGPGGRWDAGQLDEDMHFWKVWRESGRSLHLATRVRLGHIEEYVSWPAADWTTLAQSMRDYHESGMPEGAK